MTDQTIGAGEEAQATVASFQGYDPGAPSSAALSSARGVSDGPAQLYISHLQEVGRSLQAEYRKLKSIIDSDCEIAVKAIADLREIDEEGAAQLNAYYGDQKFNSALNPNGDSK
jgi:hypothetical protein